MEEPGCPICQVGLEQERRYFFWFFAENHHSPETLMRLVDTQGFCLRHARGLAAGGGEHDAALASVYEFLSRKVAADLKGELRHETGTWPGRVSAQCPVCASREGAEERLLDPLARLLADELARERYHPPHLLCHTHLQRLEPHLDTGTLRWVVDRNRDALDAAIEQPFDAEAQRSHVAELSGVVREVDVSAVYPEHRAEPAVGGLALRAAVERTLEDERHCPVCVAQAEAYRAWARFCEAHAGGREPIEDLLPTCDEHVGAFLAHGSDGLRERTLANLAPLLQDVLVRSLGDLDADSSSSWWTRLKAIMLSGRRESGERRARKALQRRPACPVCAMQQDAESRALDLCALLVGTGPGRQRYENGHGLCLRHLRAGLARRYGSDVRSALLGHARLQVELVAWELQEAGRLDAWTARPLPRASEREGWRRALYRFEGGLERP
jgi:hypothetical protein